MFLLQPEVQMSIKCHTCTHFNTHTCTCTCTCMLTTVAYYHCPVVSNSFFFKVFRFFFHLSSHSDLNLNMYI